MKSRGLSTVLTLVAAVVSILSATVFAQGPENTLLVVNEESPASLAVANHYIQLRNIAACNVLYLGGITTVEKIGEESSATSRFKPQILDPILRAMKDRGIENQIDCVAYSAGFPTRYNFQPQMKTYLKDTGKKYQLMLHAPWVSLTSLTYFHRNVYSESPDFLELDANHFANPRRMKVLANPFSGDDAARYDAATKKMRLGDYPAAIEALIELARRHRHQVFVVYALARCLALNGEKDKAITALEHLKSLGFAHRSLLNDDRAFFQIKSLQAFRDIVEGMGDLPDGIIATRSFSSQYVWAKNGWRNGTVDQGDRYLLSSVLAVAGTNQSTLAASLSRLESSAAADGSRPDGNVYFADHKDVRSRTRKNQFPSAVKELESLGHSAKIGPNIYPKGDHRVIGVTMGSAAPKWPASKSRFLPGAICDNLTSYGAWWEKKSQTQISEYLDAGAAGASGTVYEPYAIAPKFPDARWHAHYARGAGLAESFFQSVSGPFQLLLVGDPLCRPFGKFPAFKVEGLGNGAKIDSDFVLQIKTLPRSPQVRRYEIYYDGVFLSRVSNPENVAVATDGMNAGYHELRVVGISDSPVPCRTSEAIGFLVDREGQSLKIIAPQSKAKLNDDLLIRAVYSGKGEIQIHQNARPVGLVEQAGRSKRGSSIKIPAARLGLGVSKLQAVVVFEDGTLTRSRPVSVEVLP